MIVRAIFLTAGIALWQTFYRFVEQADTRFVMNIGRYVLEHGIPRVDPFTVHEGLQLVAQQWLSGVFFWETYKNFGLEGLLAVDYIFGAAAVIIFWRLCLMVSGGNKSAAFVMALAVGLFVAPMIVPRPHILSAVVFVAEVFLLEKFTRTGSAKFLLPLPVMSALLVNLHAAMWAMSLVLCLPFLFVKNVRHVKILLAAMAGIFLCGLMNPYGFDAMTYVVRSYGVDLINAIIPEMRTPSAHGLGGKIFYATAALTIFAAAKSHAPWRYVLLGGGLMYLAVMHWRNVMLFFLAGTLPIAWAARNFSAEKFFGNRFRPLMMATFFMLLAANTLMITLTLQDVDKVPAPLMILFAAALMSVLWILFAVKAESRVLHPTILPRKNFLLLMTALVVCGIFIATFDDKRLPPPKTVTDAIGFILRTERPEDVSLYVEQGYGGLAGEFGVRYYIDSRSEVFLKANNARADILAEYTDFMDGRINYRDFFARYKFTHIILTSEEPFLLDELTADKSFRVIYESERAEGSAVVRCKVFVPKEFHP